MIVGYRWFRVTPHGTLTSTFYWWEWTGQPPQLLDPRVAHMAPYSTCDHRDPRCTAGIVALKEFTPESMAKAWDLAMGHVMGAVALWGWVKEFEDGYLGENAKVLALFDPVLPLPAWATPQLIEDSTGLRLQEVPSDWVKEWEQRMSFNFHLASKQSWSVSQEDGPDDHYPPAA